MPLLLLLLLPLLLLVVLLLTMIFKRQPAVHFNKCIFIGSTNAVFCCCSCYCCHGEAVVVRQVYAIYTQVEPVSTLLTHHLHFNFHFDAAAATATASAMNARIHQCRRVSFETGPHSFESSLPSFVVDDSFLYSFSHC